MTCVQYPERTYEILASRSLNLDVKLVGAAT